MDSYAVDSPTSPTFPPHDNASTFDPYPSVQQPSFPFNARSEYADPSPLNHQHTSYYSHEDASLRSEPMAIDPSFIAPSQLIAPSAIFPCLSASANSSRSSSTSPSSSLQPEGTRPATVEENAQFPALKVKKLRAKDATVEGPFSSTAPKSSNSLNLSAKINPSKSSTISKTATSKSTAATHLSKPLASTSKLSLPASNPLESDQWSKIYPSLKENLTPVRFTKAPLQTVMKLAEILSMFTIDPLSTEISSHGDTSEVPPSARIEVLNAMLMYGKQEFWANWVGRDGGMLTIQAWLKGALITKDKDEKMLAMRSATLLPVLKVSCSFTFSGVFDLSIPSFRHSCFQFCVNLFGNQASAKHNAILPPVPNIALVYC